MYQLLLVEDEKSIAQGMANGVPWREWGFTIAGICGNGEEAVEFLKEHQVDLVLSDIRMPKMDGIALMQYLSAHYPDIKIIILSGYNDFEYLQMFIRNRVVEYLLKPTDVDEFQELFGRMKQILDKEAKEREEQAVLHREQRNNALLRGYGYEEEEAERELFRSDTCRYGVVLFTIDNGDMQHMEIQHKALWYRKKLETAVFMTKAADHIQTGNEHWVNHMQILDSTDNIQTGNERRADHIHLPDKVYHTEGNYLQEQSVLMIENEDTSTLYIEGEYWCNYEEEIVGLVFLSEDQEEDQLRQYLNLLTSMVNKELNIDLSCGISCFYEDYRMLPVCYEQAKSSLEQKGLHAEEEKLTFFRQLSEERFDTYQIPFDEERILKAIAGGEEDAITEEIQQIFAAFQGQTVRDADAVNRIALEILFTVSRKILKYGVAPEKLMEEKGYSYRTIYQKRRLEEKQAFLEGIFRLYAQACQTQQTKYSKTSELAHRIKDLVDQEYMTNWISLEYVGEQVHKNTAYISKIFKTEFDCNFSTYVTNKRLDKSTQMLRDPVIKIYEMAEQLGWVDVSNFIKVFKKRYGMSPDEYRKLLLADRVNLQVH